MYRFFNIKIYRRKFYVYLVFVVLINLILGIFTCQFLINTWIKSSQEAAFSAFERVENKLQSSVDKAESYMLRIYSNNDLMHDLTCFLGNDSEHYLTKRLENSKYNESLYSFPDDAKYFVGDNGKSMISQMSLHTEESANVIHFLDSGGTSLEFCISNDDSMFQSNVEKGILYTKKLSDPNQISKQIGEVRFLISGEKAFRSAFNHNMGSAMAVDDNGGVYLITPETQKSDFLIHQVLKDSHNQGSISNGFLKRIHYVVYSSSRFGYKFIFTIDSGTIIQQNAGQLLFITMIFLVIIISIMMMIISNLHYDASFLGQIIQTINNVKVGKFTNSLTTKYRKNEYGMIARELNDMSEELDRYIRTEYLLKLKQQETEMKALQNQINPHFLYNTLETIRSFALVNQDEVTAEAIANLGGMYRDIVKNKSIITIDEELQLLQKYLKIMEFKYSNNFYYQINVDPELRKMDTIKLWMQPLAENFFVHGFDQKNQFNLLIINGREEENRYVIELVNNGSHIDEEKLNMLQEFLDNPEDHADESIGIRNVYTRLRFFYGDAVSMKVGNNTEAGITISVFIRKEDIKSVSNADCG